MNKKFWAVAAILSGLVGYSLYRKIKARRK